MAHKVLLLFLVFVIAVAVLSVGVIGFDYYGTPISERPFHHDYESMKPSGNYSHGLGIIGACMIIIGVSTYSTRKRIRALWNLGKLSRWLEFHIFLCLFGPMLVVFHTTFKAGGIAAISLWTMLSVAGSGIIGRFLYVQIPRNIRGGEMTVAQITSELDKLSAALSSSKIGAIAVQTIFLTFNAVPKAQKLSQFFTSFLKLYWIRLSVRRRIHGILIANPETRPHARELTGRAGELASLIQKSLVLVQVEKLFYYWHVIHLPFTFIMFITLAAHVTVTVILGYRWIF
jgi:hypothetical protein